ncbi:MAG: hypothetical protein FWG58_02490 [Methanomassiliicoccaceae archaeon]|nr:hypothetical protein [Methanomassiliicoccaceae archaeon]
MNGAVTSGSLLLDTVLMMSNENRRSGNDPNIDLFDAEIQEKIMINGTSEQRTLIKKIINDSFTHEEQKAMVEKGGLIISVEDLPFDIAGIYYGKEDGLFYRMHINTVCLDDGDRIEYQGSGDARIQ